MLRWLSPARLAAAVLLAASSLPARGDDAGVVPVDASGRALNLGFESGDLRDWTAEGDAFDGQPVEGDAVHARRADMRSQHDGRFWAGTFERKGDPATGTLTSRPFRVTHPFASFLVGAGWHAETRVELVKTGSGEVIFKASGEEVAPNNGTEAMSRVAVDLGPHRGEEVFLRLVDQHQGHWGHINFDDFRFHATRPNVPPRAKPPAPDVYAHDGLSPEEAAKAMTLPPGFEVTLFAGEPDVVQPIACALDDRGRLWVAEAYSYPHRVAPEEARDRILIFEDADGDGRFDRRTVFLDHLNLVSGLELGLGGVWIGAAPELLFVPDRDGDDVPDGPAEVVLDGWGMHDTHETLNSFAWGPDGWLYGCHGVFTHSRVGTPGTPDAERVPINAGVWRYHPTKKRFEVFAHGTSNPWGIDWDARGNAFITACVIPHLYHMIPGGRYERQAGPHFNPYTFDDIKTIADHRHYVGANPHGGNGRSDSAGGGHAHAGAMIALGQGWPEAYRGSIFMNNIHGARINRDTLTRRGSGFVGGHAPDFLLANDRWSQIVSIKEGPDGLVYLIDWYDKNQCHRVEENVHDRTNGRVFRVRGAVRDVVHHDLKGTSKQLATLAVEWTGDEWAARRARRILQERGPDPSLRDDLAAWAFTRGFGAKADGSSPGGPDVTGRLRALWMLHATGNLDADAIARGLANDVPEVRGWTVRLATEDGEPSSKTLATFAKLAQSDPSPIVRLELASALQRLPLEQRWDILGPLVQHAEDADDHNLPLMDWYAAEPLAPADPSRALKLALAAKVPTLLPFTVRRIGAIGTAEAIALLVDGAAGADDPAARRAILAGLNEALKGRRRVDMPAGWPKLAASLADSRDAETRGLATALGVTFGDPKALEALRAVVADAKADANRRREALESLRKARPAGLSKTLRALLDDPDLRGPALKGLAAFDDPETPAAVLRVYGSLAPAERRDALNTLAARADFARRLLAAVEAKDVPRSDLSADLVRQIRNLKSPALDEQIGRVWGAVRETSADRAKAIAAMKAKLAAKPATPPDVNLGRAVFARTCAQCHTLFGTGGQVGPELTGSNRADLDYVLQNVLDPGALIGKDYLAHVVATADGRTLTGIIRAEDKDAITLVTANETLVIPLAEVEERKPSEQSMMPEDLWQPLSDHEVRSLVAYLASPAQVPMLATAENVAAFFDGKSLAGWQGDPKLWAVEDGQLVGRTEGLARNEFLRSELMLGDFSLTVRVKLAKDEGNSGIQFRSEPLPNGEVRGYQADVGPGWWGKLYEENGRGLLWDDPRGGAAVRPGQWNEYRITAVGPKVDTWINGVHAADLSDPAGARRGIIALQLHSGGPTEVRFRDFRLELIGPRGGK